MNTSLRILPGTRRVSCPILACLLLVGTLLLPALLGTGIPVLETRAQAQPTTQVTLPRPDHIVIVIEENKGFSDIINSPNAPYLNSLVTQGASLTSFNALHHPSQPNYMEVFSDASQGVFNDRCLTAQFAAPSLGGNLIQKGLSFNGYAEDLPLNLMTCKTLKYGRKHCPWIDFTDVPAESSANFTKFPKDAAGFAQLPVVSFVIPNLLDDMHFPKTITSHPIPQEVVNGDAWLRKNLDAYVQWAKTHNSLFIVTWDEDASTTYNYPITPSQKINTQPPDNHIATILVGAMVTPGVTSNQPYTHYDLLRTIEDMYGLPLIGGSQNASDITGIWK